MILFPAIDLKDGKVVRLLQGKFDQIKEYSNNPVEVAQRWSGLGAEWLHVVDLDGALTGEMKNLKIISDIIDSVNIPIQMGGGIRTLDDMASLFNLGVKRLILGTKVIEDRKFLKRALSYWPGKVAVSLDCINGYVAKQGWTYLTRIRDIEFAMELESMGLKYLIYTNISKDGTLQGPDIPSIQNLLINTMNISVILSGGIKDIENIREIVNIKSQRFYGAITGKAIYEGTLDFSEALKLCSQKE